MKPANLGARLTPTMQRRTNIPKFVFTSRLRVFTLGLENGLLWEERSWQAFKSGCNEFWGITLQRPKQTLQSTMDAHARVLHNCFGAYFATVLSKTGRPQVFVLSNMSWPSLSSTCNRIWCCLKMLSFRFRYQCCDSASSLSVVVRGCVVNWLWKWGKENQEETINVDDREAGVAGIDQGTYGETCTQNFFS